MSPCNTFGWRIRVRALLERRLDESRGAREESESEHASGIKIRGGPLDLKRVFAGIDSRFPIGGFQC